MSHLKVPPLALVVVLALSCSVFGGKDNRSYVSGNYALTLDGVKCGYLKSVQGGDVTAEVINEAVGPDHFTKKHISQPKYEDFEIQVGMSMGKPVYEWIRQSWAANFKRMNGSITAMNYKLEAQSEQQFFNALLTETTIPAMDGSSKEPAYMTVKFSPEYTRPGKGDAKGDATTSPKGEQKLWLPSSFRLEIDGLDCSRVHKIDSFTVKQSATKQAVGETRDYAKEPGKLEFPNLKITLSEEKADSWRAWHESLVIKGNHDQEKNGSLTFLSPGGKEPLATIRFYNMGIFRLKPDKAEANNEAIRRVVAELYVERMEFEYKATTVGADTPGTTPATPARELVPAVRTTVKRLD